MAVEQSLPDNSNGVGGGEMAKNGTASGAVPAIIDIRKDRAEQSILDNIKIGLRPELGSDKTLPTLLLYDVAGLKLFEKITYLEEYYLTNTEIEVLEKHADQIAERIQPDSIVVELGSGNLRKIEILLSAIDRLGKKVNYYALDLSPEELKRTLAAVPPGKFKHVNCYGLHGTYDDGLDWLKTPAVASKPKSILSLGSSIGNFTKPGAALFLKSFGDTLCPGDCLLIGIDACKDPKKIFHAYNDQDGVTHKFILNGLHHANQLLGAQDFDLRDWKVYGEYRYDDQGGRHVAFVSPKRDVVIDGIKVRQNEKLQIEESHKYAADDANSLFNAAGLVQGARWVNQHADYALHMAYKPAFSVCSDPAIYASRPVPTKEDFENLWILWDTVTRQMIPEEELLSKPIKLRNACIFYLGHIPTFIDIHLSIATGERPRELEYYQKIFERGIDPDVENPELCHDHSEIPDSWPPVEEILDYQGIVRSRIHKLLASDLLDKSAALRKALWLGYEHEAMHLETLLYMLVQSEKTLPPAGVVIPDFEAMSAEAVLQTVPHDWTHIAARSISVGTEHTDGSGAAHFGWDNEIPVRSVKVHEFTTRTQPITNREYLQFMIDTDKKSIPSSWVEYAGINGATNGTASNGIANGVSKASQFIKYKAVRTVFGKVPLKFALDWPVMASYNELSGCAAWLGGRIPTMEEVRSIYEHVGATRPKSVADRSENIPAVNSHLSNDGVEETPPSAGLGNGVDGNGVKSNPSALYVDLSNANVGFKAWHPVPVTGLTSLPGQAEIGGVWEWTSTVLEKHEGFEAMPLYPGYTADFFDGKHNVVLGGSWATIPRIAGRRSFVNWYQRNYPFVWAGARLVKDI